MTNPDPAEREDPRLQADPVLSLTCGQVTLGKKLFGSIATAVIVLGTLYGLVHQGGDMLPRPTLVHIAGAVLPDTVGQAR